MRNETRGRWAPGGFRAGLDASRVRRICLNALAIGAAVFLETVTGPGASSAATVLFYVLIGLWAVTGPTRHLLGPPWSTVVWTVLIIGGALSAGFSSSGASGPAFLAAAGLFLLVSSIETPLPWIGWALVGGVVSFGFSNWAAGGSTADAVSVLISAVMGGGFGFLYRMAGLDRRTERLTAERRAENAVLEERARIARDIHDVLAHSLGGLVIQLDALEAVATARAVDGEVIGRVRDARAVAADGLVEAKRAVDALRRLPAGIDAALGEVVTGARALGMTVAVDLRGDPALVPVPVAEVVASVTVETLTNARKHAPGAPVDIGLEIGKEAVVLRVVNPRGAGGPALSVPSGGHGVTGMRERVEIVGGTLDARGPNGMWSVECRVPYE